MEENNVEICRLCLSIVENTNFEVLEDIFTEMLVTVLVNFNLYISANPIICCNCSNILKKYHEFKMVCINNEDCVKPFINVNESLKVNLEDIKELFEDSEICNKQQTCRLCLNSISEYFANMNDEFNGRSVQNMLNSCIPELKLDLTNKPLVCQACLDSLKMQLNFIQRCFDIEEKINLYCKLQHKSSYDIIDLYDVLQFCKRIKLENESEGNLTILKNEAVALPEAHFIKAEQDYGVLKLEEVDISESMEIKTEEGENEKSNRNDENSCLENQVEEQSDKTVEEQNSFKTNNSGKRFSCSTCSFTTNFKENLKRHMVLHKNKSEIEVFRCNFCDYESKRLGSLKRHLLIHKDPSELKMFKCANCPYETKDKGNLKNHMYVHNSDPIKCKECQFESTNLISFIRHMTFHKITEPFQCAECPYITKDKKLFKEHRITHKEGYSAQIFQCNSCKYVAYQKRYLIKHIWNAHKQNEIFTCYLCNFSCKEKSSLKSHMLEHENSFKMALHKCEHCTFLTTRQTYLKRHLRKRHGTRKTLLDSPDVSSPIKSKQEDANLRNPDQKQSNNTVNEQNSPKSETKNSEKRFNCLHCNYATNIKFCLIRHLITHKNEPKSGIFRCKLCNFESKIKNGLKGHMHVHSKSNKINQNEEQSNDSGKRFCCSKCSYTAKYKYYVNRHMITHKTKSETKLFRCSVCGFESKRSNNLRRHMDTHNDPINVRTFKCTMCTYESRWKDVLEFHMNTHNTEKFKCQYCPFESRNVMFIKKHMDVHKEN